MESSTKQSQKAWHELMLIVVGLGAAALTFAVLVLFNLILTLRVDANSYLLVAVTAFISIVLWLVGAGLALAAGLERRGALGASLFLGIIAGSIPVCLGQILLVGLTVIR